jgi:hypothetical protein
MKLILELYGYKVIAEDEYNWVMMEESHPDPLILPKLGPLLGVDIMMQIVMGRLSLGVYFALKERIQHPEPPHSN